MRRLAVFAVLLALGACSTSSSPPPAVPAANAGRGYLVFFQPWSAALDPTALAIISTAYRAASAKPAATVTVSGFADTIGTAQANVYLSETRAQVVADALVADGLNPSRIHRQALGEKGTPNTSEQYERRVLIQVGP